MKTNKRMIALVLALSALSLTSCAAVQALARGDVGGAIIEAGKTVGEIAAAAIEDCANGKVSQEYTAEQEYYIGRGVSGAIMVRYPATEVNSDPRRRQLAYLNQMAGYIEAMSYSVDRRNLGGYVDRSEEVWERQSRFGLYKGVRVGLLESNEVMAYATPGGFIWISQGAVNMCQSEDELAAIIAHEMGHIVMNHGMDAYRKATEGKITDSKAFQAFSKEMGPVVGNFAEMVGGFADNLIESGYNKDQEYEADNFGTRALAAAGYDPNAMARMLERVEAYEKSHKDDDKFLSNHPDPKSRIEKVKDLIKNPKNNLKAPAGDPGRTTREKRFREVWGR